MKRTEVIADFLKRKATPELASLYDHDMEVQVMVSSDGGKFERREFQREDKTVNYNVWTDGNEEWKHFRIPWNAYSNPTYVDKPLRWTFDAHVEAIGLTGWNWRRQRSYWVGFDIDSIIGHTAGLEQDQLDEVVQALHDVDWVTVRRSKGGRGYHLYVFFETPVKTETHTEHAALARAVLSYMSALVTIDLGEKVDKLGGILWIWHKDTRSDGFSLVKEGSTLQRVPPNWRDHVGVVSGKHKRLTGPNKTQDFESLVKSYRHVKLDTEHLRIIKWFTEQDAMWWWDSDNHMLVCHTHDLKRCHRELNLRGIYDTVSTGKDCPSDQNCFAFPASDGSWTIRRHGINTKEHSLWKRDPTGWTRTEFNAEPDFETAVKFFGGVESGKGDWVFENSVDPMKALRLLHAATDELPEWLHDRRTTLIRKKKEPHRVVVQIKRDKTDDFPENWLIMKNGQVWERVFIIKVKRYDDDATVSPEQEIVRHVVASGKDAGMYVRLRDRWINEPLRHIVVSLKAQSMNAKEAEQVIGTAVNNFWEMVSLPFQSEYPGDRRWNRSAAQVAYDPISGTYPTWENLLRHVGQDLDPFVLEDEWCKKAGIVSGGDWLFAWIASMFQYPTLPLPYLFLYSTEESTGKSTFHEAVSVLFKDGIGCVRANNSITEKYNGELVGAVFCIVEELNMQASKSARDRIKDYVTSPKLSIRPMYGTSFTIGNTTHWVQCSNDPDYCPVFPGDTRIVTLYVPPPTKIMQKSTIMALLDVEAPAFIDAVMRFDLPESTDRLRVPCISTGSKEMAQELNRTLLEEFIEEACHRINGECVKFADFCDRFYEWLPDDERTNWSKIKIGRKLPHWAPRGRYGAGGHRCIGNVSFENGIEPTAPFIRNKDRLVKKGEAFTEQG